MTADLTLIYIIHTYIKSNNNDHTNGISADDKKRVAGMQQGVDNLIESLTSNRAASSRAHFLLASIFFIRDDGTYRS